MITASTPPPPSPSVQIVADPSTLPDLATGAAIRVTGVLQAAPAGGQLEIAASEVTLVGACDASTYPLQKKRHSAEFLRDIVHLRPRSNLGGAVLRTRDTLAAAVHGALREAGCVYVHTPILTSNDCEGAGETFDVTTKNCSSREHFFGAPVFLTVSGQLQAEAFATALSNVYTFGPTFRAEESHTPRHLAEFWMVEPELAWATMEDAVSLAGQTLQAAARAMLQERASDLEFFQQRVDSAVISRVQSAAEGSFAMMTYDEARAALEKADLPAEVRKSWPDGLSTPEEMWLSEQYVGGPVAVTHYPAACKPFYMLQVDPEQHGSSPHGPTVAGFDLLVPRVAELFGGSAREHRLDRLESAMARAGFDPADPEGPLHWYVQLRQYGSVPHAGWGLGFERMVQFMTGVDNIRDVMPVPRSPNTCKL